ncbi:MAG TPA: dihydrofolate reductase family protein [Candidatus Solibacter sp.]|nr:dihydrofolate reductase family protein [Candidatus Solibacter sp.]
MRRLRYSVAMSLDGFIAGPKGEANWITQDPNFDWRSLFAQFDTIVVGRKTFEPMAAAGRTTMPGIKTIVFSRTLRPEEYPDVRIVAENELQVLAALKASAGKDIWLFGGGALFRSLAEAELVDTVEVSLVPILLGAGVPLAPNPTQWINLALTSHRVYPSGIVSLQYAVRR